MLYFAPIELERVTAANCPYIVPTLLELSHCLLFRAEFTPVADVLP